MKAGWEKTMRRSAETAGDFVLSLFFPRRCPVCQDIVRPRGARVCPACREKIAFVREPLCKKCGKELTSEDAEYCYDCRTRRRSFDGGISLMNYDRVGRTTMKAFKYGGRQEYAAFYMEEIWKRYGRLIRGFRADAIVPVPIHRSRRAKRGYNQAELLARELSRLSGVPALPRGLMRVRATKAQKELTAAERQRNLEHSFAVGRLPEGTKRVILVDDIYTTGSTAEACTRALRRAGVQRVLVVTVCIGKNE